MNEGCLLSLSESVWYMAKMGKNKINKQIKIKGIHTIIPCHVVTTDINTSPVLSQKWEWFTTVRLLGTDNAWAEFWQTNGSFAGKGEENGIPSQRHTRCKGIEIQTSMMCLKNYKSFGVTANAYSEERDLEDTGEEAGTRCWTVFPGLYASNYWGPVLGFKYKNDEPGFAS